MRIVFFGTPEFAAFSLRKMADAGYNIVCVVTSPDKPAGRGRKLHESDVKLAALELGLPVLQPTNLKDPAFQQDLAGYNPDLGVVIAFRMLPQAVWSMPRLGTFNLHASLLPQYRGAAPINHALINGETETGVTTFFLKHEIDTGDIVLQEKVPILPGDNAGSLHDKLMHTGADLVLQTLDLVSKGHCPSIPQPVLKEYRHAPKLNREFCQLQAADTAVYNHNKVRGLSPYPGAWIALAEGTMKVLETEIAGTVEGEGLIVSDRKLYWKCRDGALELLRIQPQGKPAMAARDYLNGLANKNT
ncbi:MAG: methionyl-tRNA formyltransferase [Bacteroidetes bacterium]|nr:methionyl-tRNA formyltransferase [Bacteroidota bacterium]